MNSLILSDPGSTHNFISIELAQKLGIQTEEMGTALEASGAFKGQYVPVTPLIGKLCVHVQGYVDQEEFCISPLATEDVILGAPWFHRLAAVLEYPTRTISFKFRNRDISIHTEDRGSTIPIVSHANLQKSMKSNLFAYMIFAQESKQHELSVEQKDQQEFLNSFKDCFVDEIPKELPPSRGEDDHKIELIPGSSPPNSPPYRVSYAQQEEILTQVNELLERVSQAETEQTRSVNKNRDLLTKGLGAHLQECCVPLVTMAALLCSSSQVFSGLPGTLDQHSSDSSSGHTHEPLAVALPSQQQILSAPHLRDFIGSLPDHVNPLLHSPFFHPTEGFWLSDSDMVAQNIAVDIQDPLSHTQTFFHRAGPRYHVKFTPDEVKAAIVTCGGLCPGLNSVIREMVDSLWYQYSVKQIYGIKGGYRGFYSSEPEPLDPRKVDHWHSYGGTKLGTSRGGFDLRKIVDAIESQGFNQVYIIGGDGTMKGAVAIFEEVRKRKLKVCVVGLPKTVDNDVGIIDRSFGFQTAVEKAREAVNAAHVEAESTPNGLGLVKLMGRNAGHIALHATLGSRDVDCCLIPEVSFFLEGPGGLLDFVEQRLAENGHCVLVVAEGAGQDLMEQSTAANASDLSGNPNLQDIGLWLGDTLKDWWKSKHPNELFALKYIDPTYMIRAVPSNATDTAYCTLLAHSALHGAMAGYTGFVAGPINGRFCFIPLDLVANAKHLVDVENHTWAWVKSVNNQPDFLRKEQTEHSVQ
ncbi:hypothetical protein L7F22_035032 [Adiantum nelumboides]|nr:hypothetical protein [Adiantum nelumboides]